jgi:RPA family protein
MSAEGDSGPGRREVAYRLFAAEFDDASLSYSESDEERAPNFVVTPTGLRVNRLFAVGVLTEVETINEDTLRGRIVDPTGAFVTYAGQYQPPAQAFLDQTNPPAFVAITGKARTFEPEDSDRVFTSVRPESLSEVDADTRDRWVVSTAEATLHRIAVCAAALDSSLRGEELQAALGEAGVDESLAVGIPRALDHYGTTTAYLDALRQVAVDALELVADERDEVRSLDIAPNEGGETALGAVPAVDIDLAGKPVSEPATESASAAESEADAEPASTQEPADGEPTPSSEPPEPETETAPSSTTEPEESVDAEPDTADTATAEASETTPAETAAGPDADLDDSDTSTDTVADGVAEAEPDTEAANGASDPDADAETAATAGADTTDADIDEGAAEETGMYQLDEEEREELESEFDTGFSSGNDVDPAGEADIDVPDVDELAEQAEQAEVEESAEPDTANDDESLGEFDDGLDDFEDDESSTAEPVSDDKPVEADSETDDGSAAVDDASDNSSAADAEADEPPAEDIDLEETVVETMAELDDGDGVDRTDLVTELVDTYGVDEAAVEGAIADALMGGRCYEPGDGVLKAI